MTDKPDLDGAGVQALSGGQIARAAGLVMFGFVLSRVLGLAREAIIAALFGASSDYEAYAVALQVPDTIFFVIAGGAIGSAFIPTFVSYLNQDRRAEAWRMASMVLNLFLLVMIGVAVLCALLARPIVACLLAPGFPLSIQDTTVRLVRVMLISSVLFGLSGLQMGMLNAHQRFLLPALAPSMYNIGIIIGALILAPALEIGIMGVAWGVVLGAALHLIVQWPGLLVLRARYHPLLSLSHPGVREVARLMGPRVLGQAIVQVNFWVNKALASDMAAGSVAAIQRAWFLLLLPQGVIAQSVATAIFPTFSTQVARGDTEALRRTLGQVLRAVLFLSIPATVGLVGLRLPIVRLMFERGNFTLQDSRAVAWALLFFGLGLVAHSLLEVVTRAFYALHDTRTPVIVGGGAMILNVILSLTLIRLIGDPAHVEQGAFAGLALANTIATTLESLVLLLLLRPRTGGFEERRLAVGILRAGGASAGMGLVLWALLPLIDRLGVVVGTLVVILAGVVIFWGLAWLLRSEEARLFTDFALRRLRQEQRGEGIDS